MSDLDNHAKVQADLKSLVLRALRNQASKLLTSLGDERLDLPGDFLRLDIQTKLQMLSVTIDATEKTDEAEINHHVPTIKKELFEALDIYLGDLKCARDHATGKWKIQRKLFETDSEIERVEALRARLTKEHSELIKPR